MEESHLFRLQVLIFLYGYKISPRATLRCPVYNVRLTDYVLPPLSRTCKFVFLFVLGFFDLVAIQTFSVLEVFTLMKSANVFRETF
jgi:hypothetical protein